MKPIEQPTHTRDEGRFTFKYNGISLELYSIGNNNYACRVIVDNILFHQPKIVDDYTIYERIADSQKFIVNGNRLYIHMSSPEDSPDRTEYYFIQSVPERELYMLHLSLQGPMLYKVTGMEKCTGDATCRHCSECPECSALHCTEHT